MLRFSILEFPIALIAVAFNTPPAETYPCLLIWHSIRYTVFVLASDPKRCLCSEIEF
jgi:hypothetical protein